MGACGSAPSSDEVLFQRQESEEGGTGKQGAKLVSSDELQQEIQRFSGTFIDRITQASYLVETAKPDLEIVLLRRKLLYSSSIIEIASGEVPEANLLDMITFINLSLDRLNGYWKNEVFGSSVTPLVEAFSDSARDVNRIASQVMSDKQLELFGEIINAWKVENPDLVLVERVRLTEISAIEGAQKKLNNQKAQGLLKSVKGAVAAADEGVLLANRAFFMAQHMPTLFRMQARIGAQEVLADSLKTMSKANGGLAQMQEEVDPVLMNLTVLAKESGESAKEFQALLQEYRDSFPEQENDASTTEKLGIMSSMLKDLRAVVFKLNESGKGAKDIISEAKNDITSLVWTIALALLLVGVGIGIAWWCGYFFAKRALGKARS